jgi:Family of unknown function (DUF6252)
MKNLISVFAILSAIVLLTCCKKTETTPSASVTFKVDSTTAFQSALVGSTWEPTNNLLNLTAKGGKSIIVINVQMNAGLKAGTYPISAASVALTSAFFRPDTSVTTEGYYSIVATAGGSLVISSVTADSLITGTFSFNLINPTTSKVKKITLGVYTNVKVVNNKSIVTTGSNTFSAKIDGVLFAPTQIVGGSSFGQLVISASNGTKSIAISVPSNIAVGAYTMDFFGTSQGIYNPTLSATGTSYSASSATSKLTITEHNTTTKSIKGTFNFKGTDQFGTGTTSFLITEGAFSIKY